MKRRNSHGSTLYHEQEMIENTKKLRKLIRELHFLRRLFSRN